MKFDRLCNSFLNEGSEIDDAADLRDDKIHQTLAPQPQSTNIGSELPNDSQLPDDSGTPPEEEGNAEDVLGVEDEPVEGMPELLGAEEEDPIALAVKKEFGDKVDTLMSKYPNFTRDQAELLVKLELDTVMDDLKTQLKTPSSETNEEKVGSITRPSFEDVPLDQLDKQDLEDIGQGLDAHRKQSELENEFEYPPDQED